MYKTILNGKCWNNCPGLKTAPSLIIALSDILPRLDLPGAKPASLHIKSSSLSRHSNSLNNFLFNTCSSRSMYQELESKRMAGRHQIFKYLAFLCRQEYRWLQCWSSIAPVERLDAVLLKWGQSGWRLHEEALQNSIQVQFLKITLSDWCKEGEGGWNWGPDMDMQVASQSYMGIFI